MSHVWTDVAVRMEFHNIVKLAEADVVKWLHDKRWRHSHRMRHALAETARMSFYVYLLFFTHRESSGSHRKGNVHSWHACALIICAGILKGRSIKF